MSDIDLALHVLMLLFGGALLGAGYAAGSDGCMSPVSRAVTKMFLLIATGAGLLWLALTLML